MFQAEDVFSAFFGGQQPRGAGRRSRAADTAVAVSVTLEELYNGTTKDISRRREAKCSDCSGSGAKGKLSVSQTRCAACRGSGMRIVVQQMGMMTQQMQMLCGQCRGTGSSIRPEDQCSTCNGRKVVSEVIRVNVPIPRGAADKEKILLRGQGDTDPEDLVQRDLIVVVDTQKHATFARHGDDLHMKHTITLAEALCGFQFKLTHLDGREVTVRRNRGEVTRPGEMNMIRGEGMPVKRRGGANGDLFVHLDIAYPESLTEEQLAVLQQAIPRPSNIQKHNEEDATDVCYATRMSVAEFRAEMEKEDTTNDYEDEEGGAHVGGCPMQ